MRSSAQSSSAPSRFEGRVGPMELNIPAIEGIGGSLIYLVDRYGEQTDLRRGFPRSWRRSADRGCAGSPTSIT